MDQPIVEEHIRRVQRSAATGRIIAETRLFQGREHALDGPAELRFDPVHGTLVREAWFRNGLPYREDGPCITEWDPLTQVVLHQAWAQAGGLHREGGNPAKFTRNSETGVTVFEGHYRHGSPHNPAGPAIIERDPHSGKTILEEWRQQGQLTRVDGGPARIETDPKTGVAVCEEFWVDGELHRQEFPARIYRDPQSGITIAEEAYHRGRLVPNPK